MSQEYFTIDNYALSLDIAKSFANDLGYRMRETSLQEIKINKKIEKPENKDYVYSKTEGCTPFD